MRNVDWLGHSNNAKKWGQPHIYLELGKAIVQRKSRLLRQKMRKWMPGWQEMPVPEATGHAFLLSSGIDSHASFLSWLCGLQSRSPRWADGVPTITAIMVAHCFHGTYDVLFTCFYLVYASQLLCILLLLFPVFYRWIERNKVIF